MPGSSEPSVSRNAHESRTKSIAILTYHSLDTSGSVVSVAPQAFADQMGCLARMGYKGISLGEALDFRDLHGSWPADGVVVTFDDGFANFYDCAYPVLLRHKFTATVFLVSGHMGGSNDWETPPLGLGSRPTLSWQQASEISAAGIEIGSHTKSHPDLQQIPLEMIEDEIRASKTEIENHTGKQVVSFAYPFGSFNRASLDIVKQCFRAACTTFLRRAETDDLHKLPRIDMYYIKSERSLNQLLSGRLEYYLTIRRLARTMRRALASSL
jgi:peptidoglycan/xylan/chitin deacetylase (PgdA/CDA1 family)